MSAPNPDCPDCGGTGRVEADPNPPHPPTFHRCGCALRGDILANVERGFRGLTKAPVISGSPLTEKLNDNLWVTAENEFLAHLRHVAVRQPISWAFKVVSDAELVTAWLATVALDGKDIHDADAAKISTKFLTVPDLVVPPTLLVIQMGVKVARNAAACEVLAEALNIRLFEGKPTWVWDPPSQPLGMSHLFWSDQVARSLALFERIKGLETVEKGAPKKKSKQKKTSGGRPGGRRSLRGGSS